MHDIRPFIPELFLMPGTLLYIGAREDAHSWLDELHKAGHSITVLEVWQPNLEKLATDERITNLVLGDVREAYNIFAGNFDYVFWWHGPEHLKEAEIYQALVDLESKTNRLIALACPYGIYYQGAHEGNPYVTHQSTLYPMFFRGLGYSVKTDGEQDIAGSEIVAWKKLAI